MEPKLQEQSYPLSVNQSSMGLNQSSMGLHQSSMGLNQSSLGINQQSIGLNRSLISTNKSKASSAIAPHKSVVSTNIVSSFQEPYSLPNARSQKIFITQPRRNPKKQLKRRVGQQQKYQSLWQLSKYAQHLFSRHVSIRNCLRQLQVSYRKIRKLKTEFDTYGRIRHPKQYHVQRSGTPLKKMQEMNHIRNLIKTMVNQNCALTLKGIRKELIKQGIVKEISTISTYLKDINYTRKKIRDIPIQRNTRQKIIYRQKYCEMIQKIPMQNLVFLDQTSFHQNTNPRFGWAPKGLKPALHVSTQKKKWVTLLAAVSIRGFQAIRIIKGPLNHTHICQFLQHYLDHLQQHQVLIFDNARIHHAAAVKQKIAQLNRPVRYLPAYTPQLNPIQNIFAQIKSKFLQKREERQMSCEQVQQLIKQSIKMMQGKSFQNYFGSYKRWVEKGKNGQIFI